MAAQKPLVIDLNTADEETLVRRLKIHPRLAKRIVSVRPFRSVEDLQKLWGVDAATLAQLAALIPSASPPAETANSPEPPSSPTSAELYSAVPAPITRAEPLETRPAAARKPAQPFSWVTSLVLVLILLGGAYFRFLGLNWDSNTHQHPDERFITMVSEGIHPVGDLAEFFNTDASTLNPLRFGSYTYGMLPLFITRYVAEWLQQTEYDKVVLLGRALSGLFDLAAVLLLYLVGSRYYNRRVGLLAAALASAAVLPIQLSHYYAVDSFSTIFVVAAFWFAVQAVPILDPDQKLERRSLVYFGLFGLVVGLAMACKINTAPIFGLVVLAGLAHLVTIWRWRGERRAAVRILIQGWLLAGLVTVLAFRIFQPYAFAGPGLLGLKFNERWLAVIREVADQVAGKSEWPPNHHWAGRSVTYALDNMIRWGMGVPLGAAAWLAWLWAAWRIWRGDWRRHLLPFVWVGGYFVWQNIQFWRYMRYFMPIYPLLILLAAWALIEVYDSTRESRAAFWGRLRSRAGQPWNRAMLPGALSLLALVGVVAGAYGWAFAFTRIYTRPHSRVTASRWMLANLPGPINLSVQTGEDLRSYPGHINHNETLAVDRSMSSPIRVVKNGTAQSLSSDRVRLVGTDLRIRLTREPNGDDQIAEGRLLLLAGDNTDRQELTFEDVELEAGRTYYVHYDLKNSGIVSLEGILLRSENIEEPSLPLAWSLAGQEPGAVQGSFEFIPGQPMRINRLAIEQFQQVFQPSSATLQITLARQDNGEEPLASVTWSHEFTSPDQVSIEDLPISPVELRGGETYFLIYQVQSGGPLKLYGEPIALETSWDDGLPLGVDGYDALGGIYNPFVLELYEPDSEYKRERIVEILDRIQTLVIPSNRAFDAMPRLPLRYPLTLAYYQALFDCAGCQGDTLEAAAYRLEPGFHSPLGFDLVATFTSYPNLGPLQFNDQFADESFTVYDHPKVLIFQKSAGYNRSIVRAVLDNVDISQVLEQSPMLFTRMPTGLRLPADRLAAQTAGGTWSEMFNVNTLVNRSPFVAAASWYLLLWVLGGLAFPLTFMALRGLSDRGYPLARLIGLLVVAWLAWILGSYKLLPFTRAVVALCVVGLALVSLGLAWRRRAALTAFVRERWRYLAGIEGLFLGLFLFDLTIRLANPDLWHPWMGGERPMDFAFFNAVVKAVYFPPAHPWFSGNYINYYYYGYVVAAIPTKLLGLVPATAFNLILPAWFALTGTGIFSVVYNLVSGPKQAISSSEDELPPDGSNGASALVTPLSRRRGIETARLAMAAGGVAVALMLLLGNLYQVRQLYQYLPEIGAPSGLELNSFLDRAGAAVAGGLKVLSGSEKLPGDNARWFFSPSRPILHDGPDTPIAEFPLFTFLYADMHPHLLSMPALFAGLAWILAFLFRRGMPRRWPERIAVWFAAGIVFGFTRPAHTWDFPTLVGLAVLAIAWSEWRARPKLTRSLVLRVVGQIGLLVGLSIVFYAPFSRWFGTEYTSFELWKGARTPLGDYLTVHGLFLFCLVSYLLFESLPWLRGRLLVWRSRPAMYLLAGMRGWIPIAILAAIAVLLVLWASDYQVLAFGLPLLAWIAVLLLRRGQPLQKQVVLALAAAGVGVTLLVEVLVLKGDVGRSNMVFRYYLQAWAFFSVAAAAGLVGLLSTIAGWRRWIRFAWGTALVLLVLSAAAYPLTAIPRRVADRWPGIENPPHGLDGMAYMLGDTQENIPAIYDDEGRLLDLSSDYAGIRFMQDQVKGTPVIVEGNAPEYRWGARYSIYTGLPNVAGWNWHVRQHNSILDGALVERRIEEVNGFYNTTDMDAALRFLKRYRVAYVIVGGLEHGYYAAEGLAKFTGMVDTGSLEVSFTDGTDQGVTIYHVIP